MARISGIDLPRDKRIEIALTYIYGIGRKTATNICAATGEGMDAWYDWLRREVRAWRGEETEKENGHE